MERRLGARSESCGVWTRQSRPDIEASRSATKQQSRSAAGHKVLVAGPQLGKALTSFPGDQKFMLHGVAVVLLVHSSFYVVSRCAPLLPPCALRALPRYSGLVPRASTTSALASALTSSTRTGRVKAIPAPHHLNDFNPPGHNNAPDERQQIRLRAAKRLAQS